MTQGIFSEVGRLRRVLVCRPGLAQRRLTPANCHTLLFDDVIWVKQAAQEHHAFTSAMTERGIEVLELHTLLATTLANPVAVAWLLERMLGPDFLDQETAAELRPWLMALPPLALAEVLVGGVSRADVAQHTLGLQIAVSSASDMLLQPLPNMVLSNTLRASIMGWMKTLSAEVAHEGITCNIVAPGAIRTDRSLETAGSLAKRQGKSVDEVIA